MIYGGTLCRYIGEECLTIEPPGAKKVDSPFSILWVNQPSIWRISDVRVIFTFIVISYQIVKNRINTIYHCVSQEHNITRLVDLNFAHKFLKEWKQYKK